MGFSDLIKLFSRKGRKFYSFIWRTAGYMPHSTRLFQQAFIHKSVAAPTRANTPKENNERLEFLGDAILEAVVSDILYHKFPTQQEGYLSKLRSNMVCRARLNAIALEIGLDQHIIMTSRKDLPVSHIPGDALEAFTAAIFLDGGISRVRKFTLRHIANDRRIAEAQGEMRQDNFKSQLVNLGEQNNIEVFFETHRIPGVDNPNTDLNFTAEIKIAHKVVGRGEGRSKKAAEQMAAHAVLTAIQNGDIDLSQLSQHLDESTAPDNDNSSPDNLSLQLPQSTIYAYQCLPLAPPTLRSSPSPEADSDTSHKTTPTPDNETALS